MIRGLVFYHEGVSQALLPDQPDIPSLDRLQLLEPPTSQLIDLHDFQIVTEPSVKDFCNTNDLSFVIIVHSKPEHFSQRDTIRNTWGSIRTLTDGDGNNWSNRLIFIMGQATSSVTTQYLVDRESSLHGDLVIGNFQDKYHNLRYKNLLGLRWASRHCFRAKFFLKSDDDAFVDIFSLYQYLSRTFESLNQRNILAGNVFPDGVPAQRTGKWAVSQAEYPWPRYPSYLGGLAYLMTPDVARDLYKAAYVSGIPSVWVDDVWVTGILAKALRVQPLFLNPRYSYDHLEMVQWLNQTSGKTAKPLFTFAHLDSSEKNWKITLEQLWNSSLRFFNVTPSLSENDFQTKYSFAKETFR